MATTTKNLNLVLPSYDDNADISVLNSNFQKVDDAFSSGGGSGEGGGGVYFETDETLKLEDGILSVNTVDVVEEDNTLPITSAAVYAEVGNINALLATI